MGSMNLPPILMQSKDHGQLLDVIDLLRKQGISNYVSLPQLIVCGDQSSGKSSVLEAISRVRFPTKDNLCTRFATELILRRDTLSNVTVAITPGAERTDEEKKKLLGFKAPTTNLEDFPALVYAAKEAMGLNSDTKAFSDDVLRVEISGPSQPHLTLVDLPGLYHAGSKQQSNKDKELVALLIRSYMVNPRSIILAVVSAKNDYVNQIVTQYARDVDPTGLRTLGIITKPDDLYVGSESEAAFIRLAKNEEVSFRLGWHVLKNRDYKTRDCSTEERNEAEAQFFSQGIWTSLPTSSLGIDSLIPRLSTVLKDQILSELPSLKRDIKNGIDDCEKRLAKLGEARATAHEQRLYLTHISQSFSSIIKASVDGVYVDKFFGDAKTDIGYSKRLRAVVQNLMLEFAEEIRHKGHAQEIVDDNSKTNGARPSSRPLQISRSNYIKEVRELMRRSRGRELPGTFNPLIVGDLFFKQSKPWRQLGDIFRDKVLDAVRLTLTRALVHTTDRATMEGLLREVINPAMEEYTKKLKTTISQVLEPHVKGHPITYNHYFTETIQKFRQERDERLQRERLNAFFKLKPGIENTLISQSFNTKDLLSALTKTTEAGMDQYACSEAADCTQAYYKVAMKSFIDTFAALGIEHCLLQGLSDIFSPTTLMNLSEATVSDIASESKNSRLERIRVTTKLESLEAGLRILGRLGQYKAMEPLQENGSPSPSPEETEDSDLGGAESDIEWEIGAHDQNQEAVEEHEDFAIEVPEAAPEPEPPAASTKFVWTPQYKLDEALTNEFGTVATPPQPPTPPMVKSSGLKEDDSWLGASKPSDSAKKLGSNKKAKTKAKKAPIQVEDADAEI